MTGPGTNQFILDLPTRPSLGRADFLVTDSNAEAVDWVDRWPDWPSHVLILVGPAKSGKTHLAEVWRQQAGAFQHAAGDMEQTIEKAGQGVPICFDINGAIEDEEAFLHLFNWSKEHNATLLVTATTPPRQWPIALPDLRSRLLASNIATLGAPDDILLTAVMVKLFADCQISVTEDVVQYLLPRIERSFESVFDVVERLDKAALTEGRAVTVPLARKVLAD